MASSDAGEFEWDDAAEAELVAIEASYASAKRRAIHSVDEGSSSASPACSRRRLPNWAAACRPSSSSRGDGGIIGSVSTALQLPDEVSWNMAPSTCRANTRVRYPAIKFSGEIIYCRTPLEVEQSAKELLDKIDAAKQQVALGFDIEWKPVFERGEPLRKAAVMQICMDTCRCYVMHIFHSGIPLALKSLLEDSSSVKVGVFIDNDARKIAFDYNVAVQPLVDLSTLAKIKLGGYPKNWSLSSLTETITCKELPKPSKVRLGNWEVDVLSKEQLHYAATDAYVSWYLYQALNDLPDPTIETAGN